MTALSISRLAASRLAALTLVLSASGAAYAQLKPLPFQPPGATSTETSPSDQSSTPTLRPLQPQQSMQSQAPQQQTLQPLQPMTSSAAPQLMAAPSAGVGAPIGGMGMGGGAGAPPPEVQQCLEQFTKLRDEVEKRGKLAKAGNDKHVAREEMCKLISDLSDTEGRWVNYAAANAAKCGIPNQIIGQLKGNHTKTLGFRKMACSTGPAGGGAPATPSLSDALGTSRVPNNENATRGGTLDTLTGNPIR